MGGLNLNSSKSVLNRLDSLLNKTENLWYRTRQPFEIQIRPLVKSL